MNRLFETVRLEMGPLGWNYRGRAESEAEYRGFHHFHPCAEFLFVHEGSGSVIADGAAWDIRPGMLFLFQPYQLHKVYVDARPDQPYVRTVCHFDPSAVAPMLEAFPDRLAAFRKLCHSRGLPAGYDVSHAAAVLEGLLQGFDDGCARSGGLQEEVAALFVGLMTPLRSAVSDLAPSGTGRLRYSEAVMSWIDAHYADEVQLDAVAEQAHLSKFHLSRVFREETGSSVTEYLTARRIRQACRLLQTTDWPVERIGAEVGLPNASYFIQLFRKVVGITPLKYRNRR